MENKSKETEQQQRKTFSLLHNWTVRHVVAGIVVSVCLSMWAHWMIHRGSSPAFSPYYYGSMRVPHSDANTRPREGHPVSVNLPRSARRLNDNLEYQSFETRDYLYTSYAGSFDSYARFAPTGDDFQSQTENKYHRTSENPVSTFSMDVDTSSYSYVRKILKLGRFLPSPDAIKIEEMINYFDYDYPVPNDNKVPFEPTVMVSDSPWHAGRKLLHIGIKGYDVEPANRPFCNIVFLIDVSGSMMGEDRLPLAKKSIELLLGELLPQDYVSIVTYASNVKEALSPTPVANKGKIFSVLQSLEANGATFGTGGLELAYEVAEKNYDQDAINRIILMTDGDFNVGLSDGDSLTQYIEKKRETNIFLSVLGFGMGNYKDTTMKALANHGNGVAAYIDSLQEAHKVMVEEALSTIFPIAKDAKIQVEFNPDAVAEYRLVGYEKRILDREDFNNDKVDAGDIGSGHSVTAIYEFTPTGAGDAAALDELRYKSATETKKLSTFDDEYAFLKIRYKLLDEDTSRLMTTPITKANESTTLIAADPRNAVILKEFQFATAVASFAQILKGGQNTGDFSFQNVFELAEQSMGEDKYGYRREFLELVQTATRLQMNEL